MGEGSVPRRTAPCTMHLAPCTLHVAPRTLHLAPCTLHVAHLAPCTLYFARRIAHFAPRTSHLAPLGGALTAMFETLAPTLGPEPSASPRDLGGLLGITGDR